MKMRAYKVNNATEVGVFYNLFKHEYIKGHKGIDDDPSNGTYKTEDSSTTILDALYNGTSYYNVSDAVNTTLEDLPELNDGMTETHQEIFRRDYMQFIFEGLGISLMTIIGLIGNVLSIIILTRGSMQIKSINRILLCLAITDTIYISGVVFVIAIPNIYAFYSIDFTKSIIMPTVPYIYPIGMTAQTSSVYFTITVTIERYVAVCHPIYARIICTKQRATTVSICVAIFAILYNVPRWLEYQYITVYDDSSGTAVFVRYLVLTTGLRKNPTYEKYYIMFGYFTFIVSLPILILIVLNIFIYKTVKSANANRKLLTSSQEKENSLAIMLILIVIVFLVCNSISLINLFARLSTGKKNIVFLDSLRNFALVFNSSINFIIYCTYGEKFRSSLYEFLPAVIKKYVYTRQASIGGGSVERGTGTCVGTGNNGSSGVAFGASYKNGSIGPVRTNTRGQREREYLFSCSSSRDSGRSRV